jgi:hypothetical protein
MSVKAKFVCQKVEPYSNDGGKTTAGKNITMSAVIGYGPGGVRHDENESWSQATPSGQLSMHITNPAAFEQFEAGKNYYLIFETADDSGGENPPGPGQPGKP